MKLLVENILNRQVLQDKNSEEKRLLGGLFILNSLGLAIAVLVLVIKQLFYSDLANLTAEIATILMFLSGLAFILRGHLNSTLHLVFFIPLLIYLFYLSDFSDHAPPSETIYFTLWWFIFGLIYLAYFSSVNLRFWLFGLTGIVSVIFHISESSRAAELFSFDQAFILNPLFTLTFVFFIILLFRSNWDKKFRKYHEEQLAIEKQIREIFQQVKQPLAQIRAERDPDGNILKLEIEKINLAFEANFRISSPEAKKQELNYLFNYVFRNNTNWNDLFIINPRQQTEIFSPYLDRWFNLHMLWMNPHNCLAIFYDITQEKKEIKHLHDTRKRYLALLEAIPDIFFVIDRDGTYEDIVIKDDGSLKLDSADIIGNTIFDMGFSDKMAKKIFDCIQRAINLDSIESIEYALETDKGTLLFEMRLAKLNENSVISIARDITRRKNAEFELERAKKRAEDAVSLKSRFLANLSHDVRTPINIIINLTKVMTESGLTSYQKEEYFQGINLSANQLLNMIDNTIHLSKIETNTLDFNISFCKINPLLRKLFNHFYTLLPDNRDLQLKMDIEIQHEETGFETDPNLLEICLSQLLDNAIKFTDAGVIRFGYQSKAADFVEFFVEDTGRGIPAEELENIFLRFYTIENKSSQRSGPGIGLSIAQHLAALLGGELKVASTVGKGSRFSFDLPLKNPRGFMRVIG